jgi:hypothetical protein
MTVTWIDSPGSALASRTDTVDFSTSADVVAISISFGVGAEERVYRDGAFVAPYLASTRTVNTFALRRVGGWPKSPTVYVDEAVVSAKADLQPLDYSPLAAWALDSTAPGGYQAARHGTGYGLGTPPMSIGADLRPGHTCVFGSILGLTDNAKDVDFRFAASAFTVVLRYWCKGLGTDGEFLVGNTAGASGFVNSWEFRVASDQRLKYACGSFNAEVAHVSTTVPLGPWCVVSFRRNAARSLVRMGVNTTFAEIAVTPTAAAINGAFRLSGATTAPFVQGGLADCVVWPSWLTDAQIIAQHNVMMGIAP